MKLFFFILLFNICYPFTNQAQNTFPYRVNKLWGLKRDNIWVVNPSKSCIKMTTKSGYFQFYENKRWGLMDSNGKVIISPEYHEIEANEYGFRVMKNEGQYGFFDVKGRVVLQTEYELLHNRLYIDQKNGYAPLILVEKNGLKGLFNIQTQQWVFPLEFSNIDISSGRFGRKWISANKHQAYALYSIDGQKITEEKYQNTDASTSPFPITNASKEYCVVQDLKGLYGVVDSEGKEVISCKYLKMNYISENKVMFTLDGKKWGFLQVPSGNIVIQPMFEDAWVGFKNNLCQVVKIIDNKPLTGYIDTIGNFHIKPKYNFAVTFPNAYAWVFEGSSGYIINLKTGNKINQTSIQSSPYLISYGFVFSLYDNEKQGLIGFDGKILIEPEYNYLTELQDGKILAYLDNEQHLYDSIGHVITKGSIFESTNGYRAIHTGKSTEIIYKNRKIADVGKNYFILVEQGNICEVYNIGDKPVNPMNLEGMAPPEIPPTLEEIHAPDPQFIGYVDSQGNIYWTD